jgi:ornithine cyclodeaminase/alanine dehydrogenase-like protein (mu-crystallin family)
MHRLRLGRDLLYLSRRDVEAVGVGMAEIIQAVTQALGEKGEGRVEMPPKPGIHTRPDAFIHAMPAFVPVAGAAGLKWIGGYPENLARHGLPYISGLLILNDVETGIPLAVMDATWITAMRTGAVSGLSARLLARPGSRALAIFGCGVQAHSQLEALVLTVPKLSEVRCYDIVAANRDRFIDENVTRFPSLRFEATDTAEEAAVGADILMTAGPILKHPSPTLQAGWLKEGILGLPIDFDSYWGPEALQLSDRYFVDDRAQYRYYQDRGYFGGAPDVDGDLGELVSGALPGRRSSRERIVAMNLGLAIEDVVTARLVYDLAVAREMGLRLDL